MRVYVMNKQDAPNYDEERKLIAAGYQRIVGCDEAGRGAWCGPVVAAAVILPNNISSEWISQVRDSKMLDTGEREVLYGRITSEAVCWAVGIIDHQEIDSVGILNATKRAMLEAVSSLPVLADFLLIDYVRLPVMEMPQKSIVHGDIHCLSIACASIIAKVTRDRVMESLDKQYPGYFLAKHKGYGTSQHMAKILSYGVLPIHRRSFAPIKKRLKYLL